MMVWHIQITRTHSMVPPTCPVSAPGSIPACHHPTPHRPSSVPLGPPRLSCLPLHPLVPHSDHALIHHAASVPPCPRHTCPSDLKVNVSQPSYTQCGHCTHGVAHVHVYPTHPGHSTHLHHTHLMAIVHASWPLLTCHSPCTHITALIHASQCSYMHHGPPTLSQPSYKCPGHFCVCWHLTLH